jgi:putative tryptophan/tyrosine transport system substrate-binding protein
MELDQLKRREFIALLGGAAAGPLTARAQQAGKLPTIGFLGAGTPSPYRQLTAAFAERLRELGWIEGRTVAIEYRWAEGRSERFVEIAAEFVRLRVDVMVMESTPAVLAAKQATSVIPIVFPLSGDPVGAGLVASLARPGANVTGLSIQQTDLAGKRLELLREIIPSLRRLAMMADPTNPATMLDLRAAQAAARTLGLDAAVLETRRGEEIASAIEALSDRPDALYLVGSPLMFANRVLITGLALTARLPTVYGQREFVEAGGLISYGPNFSDMFRRTADFVDKILRGTKPGDIPVEQPTKFDVVINMKAARALGLQIPDKLLALADEVIE